MYPNPVNDVLNLQFDNAQNGSYDVLVYNVSGQVVASEKVDFNANSNSTSLNTSGWAPGIYFVNLQADKIQQVIKVVRQ